MPPCNRPLHFYFYSVIVKINREILFGPVIPCQPLPKLATIQPLKNVGTIQTADKKTVANRKTINETDIKYQSVLPADTQNRL